ncbi:hypothetical protein TNCV_3724211 [Trichonephila clavipes]|nr:hypothetical protein TNCV_3724211 [Trichonephila clavipes]
MINSFIMIPYYLEKLCFTHILKCAEIPTPTIHIVTAAVHDFDLERPEMTPSSSVDARWCSSHIARCIKQICSPALTELPVKS